jgi:hypothetical protein
MIFDQSGLLYVPFAAILTQEGSIFNSFLILFAESAAEIPQRRFFLPQNNQSQKEKQTLWRTPAR